LTALPPNPALLGMMIELRRAPAQRAQAELAAREARIEERIARYAAAMARLEQAVTT
jgi:hypothetical protein